MTKKIISAAMVLVMLCLCLAGCGCESKPQANADTDEVAKQKVEELLRKDRVDYIYCADYSENLGLDITVKNIIRKMAISDKLYAEYTAQLKEING